MEVDGLKEKVKEGTHDMKKTGKDVGSKIPINGPIFASSEHKKKWYLAYVLWWIGIIFILASIFLPWWSFESSVQGGDLAEASFLEMGVRPLDGPYLNTPVGDLQQLADPYVTAISVAIILPLLVPLVLGGVYGIYSAARRRVSKKTMVAPLWAVVAFITWFSYYYANSYLLSEIGLDIPARGSETLELEGYTLASASWGWGYGFYLAVGAIILLIASSVLMRKYKLPSNASLEIKRNFSAHSAVLLLFGIGYMIFGITIIVLTSNLPIPSIGALFPLISGIIIFGMSYCATDEYYVCPDCGEYIEINDINDDYICGNCNESLYSFDVSQKETKTKKIAKNIVDEGNKFGETVEKTSKDFYEDPKEQFKNDSYTETTEKKQPIPPPPSNLEKTKERKDIPTSPNLESKEGEKKYEYRYCPYCGYNIQENFQYCPKCGEQLPIEDGG